MSTSVKKAPAASKKLVAATHKRQLAMDAYAAAMAREARAEEAEAAITWDTPLGESIKIRAEYDAAQKAHASAKRALRRADHAYFIAGGTV